MEKTNIMKFTSSYRSDMTFQIMHQDELLTGINHTKFLGLELDKNKLEKPHSKNFT
jgi:hypothetical protein